MLSSHFNAWGKVTKATRHPVANRLSEATTKGTA